MRYLPRLIRALWHGHPYFFDQQFELIAESTVGRGPVDFGGKKGREYKPELDDPNFRNGSEQWGRSYDYKQCSTLGRHMRSVWRIPTKSYGGEHYAVYPEELCRTPILAGCPAEVCSKCGLPRVKVYKATDNYEKYLGQGNVVEHHIGQETHTVYKVKTNREVNMVGLSNCGCGAPFVPGVCLDPFAGTAVTGAMAKQLGRRSIGIEVSEKYCKLSAHRLEETPAPLIEARSLA